MNPHDERLVFVDLETAGIKQTSPITQIAAVAVDRSLSDLESFEVKIQFDMSKASWASLRTNHYDAEVWREHAIPAKRAAVDFSKFLRRHATVDIVSPNNSVFQLAQLVAHNSSFDGPFLKAWFDRLGVFMPASYRVFCTMQRAFWLIHERQDLTPPSDYKLLTLCEYFGVQFHRDEAHNAFADVRATAALYRAIRKVEQNPRLQLSSSA